MQMLLELDKEKEKKKSWRGKKKIKKGKTGIKVAKLWVPCQKKRPGQIKRKQNDGRETFRSKVSAKTNDPIR